MATIALNKITIYRKQYYAPTWTFKYRSTGLPYDLTGHEIELTVKKNKDDDDADAVILKDWTSHVDAAAGQSSPQLPADSTAAGTDKAEGIYWYGIQVKDASARPVIIGVGEWEIKSNPTDR